MLFCICSGQKVNFAKSKVFFSNNVNNDSAADICNISGIGRTEDLARYLVVPVIIGHKGKDSYSFITDKVRSKLSGWKTKHLSLAGRITLAQSCIMGIPNYVMQYSTLIPTAICDELEHLCRDFIWGSFAEARKCHLIS